MAKKKSNTVWYVVGVIAVLVLVVGGGYGIFTGLDNNGGQPTNAEETPVQDIQKISCSKQEFGEYWATEFKRLYPDSFQTPQSNIDFYEKFRYCQPHGATELLPYKDETGQCSKFDCRCPSGNLLKEPLSENYYCEDVNVRDLGFCSQTQFVEDYINKGGSLASKFIDTNGNFKSDEEICKTSTTGKTPYFFVDANRRTCTNPICLTPEQYNQAKDDLEFLY